jgi:hypothetical protein
MRRSILLAAVACLSLPTWACAQYLSSWENTLAPSWQDPAGGNTVGWENEASIGEFATDVGVTLGQYSLRVPGGSGYSLRMKSFDWALWTAMTGGGANNNGSTLAVDVTVPLDSFNDDGTYFEIGMPSLGSDFPFTNHLRPYAINGQTKTVYFDIEPIPETINPPGGSGFYGIFLNVNTNRTVNESGTNGVVYFDGFKLIRRHVGPPAGSSDWSDASAWGLGGIPDTDSEMAFFQRDFDFGGERNININAPVTVNQLDMDDGGSMWFRDAGFGNAITLAGADTIGLRLQQAFVGSEVPIVVNNNSEFRIQLSSFDGSPSTALLQAGISGSGTVTKTSGGNLITEHVRTSGLDVQGGRVEITGPGSDDRTSKVNSLSVAAGATLELRDAYFIVDYSAEASPLADLEAAVNDGRITSQDVTEGRTVGITDAPAADGSIGGISYDTTSVLIALTLKGDTNVDRTVNFDDLLALAQSYSLAGAWKNGDSNRDGQVTFDDLLALAQNYGGTFLADGSTSVDASLANQFDAHWAMARVVIPEPTLAGLMLVAGAGLIRRRT